MHIEKLLYVLSSFFCFRSPPLVENLALTSYAQNQFQQMLVYIADKMNVDHVWALDSCETKLLQLTLDILMCFS